MGTRGRCASRCAAAAAAAGAYFSHAPRAFGYISAFVAPRTHPTVMPSCSAVILTGAAVAMATTWGARAPPLLLQSWSCSPARTANSCLAVYASGSSESLWHTAHVQCSKSFRHGTLGEGAAGTA
eukprot:256190-Chlamydomonas_euryale.AAC.4